VSNDENVYHNNKPNSAVKANRVIPLTKRKQMSIDMFGKFNRLGFDSSLPLDMSVKWSNRLLTTAGITKMKTVNSTRVASIELSNKVVDDEERLRKTLLHEMCHAAAWVVDGEKKPPHGNRFWKWANTCEQKIKGAKITTCHAYEIFKPFRYECTNIDCKIMYARHSKNSIDITKHRCGKCKSKLKYLGNFNTNGTPKKERAATGFSLFVKENYHLAVKNRRKSQGTKASDIMLVLSKMYKEKNSKNEIITNVDDEIL
jgi:predicted SprT family Zn-dependent metalloprotease